MTLASGYPILASDLTAVITTVNNMATRYGATTYTGAIAAGSTKALNAQAASLYSILNTCNSNTRNRTKVVLTDIPSYAIGTKLSPTVLSLIQSKSTSVYNSYCSCYCNDCTCDCNDCSCDCDRCTCNCDDCTCDCLRCTCNCDDSTPCYCESYSEGTCPCFLPGQKIYTSSGIKNVEDIKYGDYVLTRDGNYSKVIATWRSNAKDKAISIYHTSSFDLSLTDDHPVPRIEGKLFFPKIKTSSNFKFSEYIDIKEELIELLPFFIELGNVSEGIIIVTTTNDVIKEKIKNNLLSAYDGLLVDITKKQVIIGGTVNGLSFSEIIGSLLVSGIPDIAYKANENVIKNTIDNYEIIGLTKTIESAYQYKLLYMVLGKECRIKQKEGKYMLQVIGDVESDEDNYLFNIEDIELSVYSGYVYNIVIEDESHAIATDVVVGDGFTKR